MIWRVASSSGSSRSTRCSVCFGVPFPKSHEILKKLEKQNVILAINSNRFTDSIETFMDKFFGDIDFILIRGHDFDNAKPGNKGMGVAHSLLGEDSAQGILDVDSNGKMKLSYVFVSGTNKSPLYVLKYNGYYKNDDPSIEGDLVKENADVKEFKWIANNELNGVSDTVVGKVTRPLGKISDAYYDEVKL